jgi:Flp pilus assembly protein TadD
LLQSPSVATDVAGNSQANSREVTYHRDIAPLVYNHCSVCHRPGETAPFPLLSYADVVSHAEQIVKVTASRFMPPWLPETGRHAIEGDRRLTPEQIDTLRRWFKQKTPEGNPADAPPAPKFVEGWQLGQPDLIVTMPTPFELPASGRDVYRNFVVTVPLDAPRWVKGMEFRPDNRRIVHHAFMMIDRSGEARRLDGQDPMPGYDGMNNEAAESPGGHFISWQPGKQAKFEPEGMSWYLTPGTDLVLQIHMQPTGKPESIQASVGFYFTDRPPVRTPYKIVLRSTDFEIPAGADNYLVETSYTLPVPVHLLSVIPHAHYLGKDLQAVAVLPDGTRETLIHIPKWDFNWQGDYRYATPVSLPKGARIIQRFTYDNSSSNPRNPNSPPRPVGFGLQSSDEMAELWLQLLPADADQMQQLQMDYSRTVLQGIIKSNQRKLKLNPRDVDACLELGKVALAANDHQRAMTYFHTAESIAPNSLDVHYHLGHALLRQNKPEEARRELEKVLGIDASYQKAIHDLGLMYLQTDKLDDAERHFRRSLELVPYHATSLSNLGLVRLRQGDMSGGIELLEQSLRVRPDNPSVRRTLEKARSMRQELIP